MSRFVIAGISTVLYLLFAIGIFVAVQQSFKMLVLRVKMRHRLWLGKKRAKEITKATAHLNMLLLITTKGKISTSAFTAFTLLLLLAAAAAGLKNYSPPAALFISALIAAGPLLMMEIKLLGVRRKASFEAESFVSALLGKYRITGFNIYAAMELTIKDCSNYKICGGILYNMLLELRNTADKNQIKHITDKFVFAVSTNWSRILAYNISLAASQGINIAFALEDILLQLREARILAEERKRLNSEASRIVAFLIPILYGATIFLSAKFAGISIGKFFFNQFLTETGFMLFAAGIFLYFLNRIILEAVSSSRFDY